MADFIFDTSAIVKRYVHERGSGWVNAITAPLAGNRVRLASLTAVEVISAIARRRRGGSIAPADANLLIAQFRHEWSLDFVVVELTAAIMDHAMDLAESHALRGADAVQLSVAVEVHQRARALRRSLTFVSADTELNAAATAEGLVVDDPNLHP